jgi:pimeloyl-ACP methyl ester carboxylesterase
MRPPSKVVLWLVAVAFALVAGFIGYQLIAVRGTFQKPLDASKAPGELVWVASSEHISLAGRMFVSGAPSPSSPLVIVLHGDAPFHNPGYHYEFASRLAKAVPGTRVIGLLRPGYSDPYGAKSGGHRGFASGDNYDEWTMHNVTRAVDALVAWYKAPSVILVGHSGGAVTTADVAAKMPALDDETNVAAAFLIGCPCDVPAFRRHMWELQHAPLWLWPVRAVSPLDTVNEVPTTTEIRAISGAEDAVAPPQEARAYVEKAKERGVDATLTLIPNEGHEILLEQSVIDAVAASVRAHTKTNP